MLHFAFPFVLNAAAALVAGPTPSRRGLALVLSASSFAVLPLLPRAPVALEAWAWMGSGFLFLRTFDVLEEWRLGLPSRLALALIVYDTRRMRPAAPSVDPRLVAKTLGFLALAATAAWGVVLARDLVRPLDLVGRYAAGLVLFYAVLDAADGLFRVAFRLAGQVARPIQDTPIRSRSLSEFWGRRWNREVGGLLYRWCFRPVARLGFPRGGVVVAFVVSALLHAIGVLAPLGPRDAALVSAFFLAHGLLTLAERPLGVARWPAWAGHAWVVAVFVVTGPLFLEPALRVSGLP